MSALQMNNMGTFGFGGVIGSVQREQEARHIINEEELREKEANRHHIDVDTMKFPSLFEVMYTDSEEFPAIINGLLRPLFADYYGSKVEVVQNRQLYTTIFFTENYSHNIKNEGKDGPYAAIERAIKKDDKNGVESRIESLNHLSNYGRSKLYKLTEKAQEMLQDIIPTKFINYEKGTVDWNKIVYESSAPLQGGTNRSTPYVQVAVDVNRILQCIYGGKTKDTGEWQYMVNVNNPIAPVATPHGTISNKWQLFITRVNTKDAQDIASQFGFVIGSNNMGIITR